MRKLFVLFAVLFFITACSKEPDVEQPSPEPIIQPEPVPVCGNGVLEPGEQCDPPGVDCSEYCQNIAKLPEPKPEPTPKPEPVQQPEPSLLAQCTVLGINGLLYTYADVGSSYIPGKQITQQQAEDARYCYVYFKGNEASSSGFCCVI